MHPHSPMRTFFALFVAIALFAQTTVAQSQVWFVSNGLEFGHFDTLQSAVDAAADGDLIVVRRGHYTPFTIDNKSLIVAAEFPDSVWVETVSGAAMTVKSVASGRSVSISDVNVFKFGADTVAGVLLLDNEGAVQLERVVVGSTKIHPVQQSLRVINCDDVEVVECGFAQGVLTRLSDVRFHECQIQGAEGVGCATTPPAKPGGPGIEVLSGNVLIADSVVRGGRGGAGSNPLNCCNASGGPGLRLGNDLPTVTVRGGSITAGFPGSDMGCAPIAPAIDLLSGTLLNETGATPSGGFASEWAHSGGMSAIVARAAAGQNAFVGFSLGAATTPTPLAKGDLLLAAPVLIIVPLGISNGFTTGVESAVPYLPPGSAPLDLFAQTLGSDPIDGPILGPRDRTRIVDLASALAGAADCDQDGITDAYAIWSGLDTDDDQNGIPDGCDAPLTLYVDDDAPNDPLPGSTAGSDPLADGSLAHPFDNLQAAVNAVAPVQFAVIELLPGTYRGAGNVNLVLQNRELKIRGMGAASTGFDLQQQAPLLRIEQGSRVTLQGFAIENGATVAESGGAIRATNAHLRLRDMRLENNRAKAGGAIYSYQTNLSVTNTAFLYNHASDDGGAIYENGPNAYQANTLGLRMVDCQLIGNTAASEGGAIYTANKTIGPRVASSLFVDNVADLNGGAVYCTSSTAVFESCHFGGNAAAYYGGAFHSIRTSTPFYLKPMTLRQCTLRGNYAFIQGAALNAYGATLLGCVLWDNTIESSTLPVEIAPKGNNATSLFFQGAYATPEFVLRDTTLQSGVAGIPTSAQVEVINGPGNNSANPLFASASASDPSLAPGSPAIDTGGATWVAPLGATDVEGDPRFVGPRIDRGADEFKP